MKNTFIVALMLVISLVSCTTTTETGEKAIDPVATGQVIGLAYTLTKDKLDEGDRESIESAYRILTGVSEMIDDRGNLDNVDLKVILLAAVDNKMAGPEFDGKREAVKAIINIYWNKVDEQINVSDMVPKEQLYILKQVHLGIEQGLGR